jgi:hypothetical protein
MATRPEVNIRHDSGAKPYKNSKVICTHIEAGNLRESDGFQAAAAAPYAFAVHIVMFI